jgi:choline-sulfatase
VRTARPVVPTAVVCLLLTSSSAIGGGAEARPRPNVILITVDTLRADRIGCYGYAPARTPALDGLAARGARFDQATAHAPLTVPSHVSILTGRLPSAHGARDNGAYVLDARTPTVASILRGAGYKTAAFVGSVLLSAEYGFDAGFQHFDDEMPATGSLLDYDQRRSAAAVAERASAWLRDHRSEPFFAWIHFYDAHAPYTAGDGPRDLSRRSGEAATADSYDTGVANADRGVAAILKTLDATGLREHTAVIVTADHGEGLGDHGEREHGLLLYDAVLRVPLIINVPGGSTRVVPQQARHIDLAPTILAIADVKPDPALRGRSLLPATIGANAAVDGDDVSYAESWYGRLHFGWSELRSIRVDGWKLIAGPRPQLYDLRHDPEERRNLYAQRGSVAARLARELETMARAEPPTATVGAADSDARERLRALGYVSGAAPTAGPLAGAGADPGEKLAAFERYTQILNAGIAALAAERPAKAIERFQQAAAEFPDASEAHQYVGYALAAAGKNRDAVIAYRRAIALDPRYALAYFNLAKALGASGRAADARAELARGFAIEPRSFFGFMTAGVVAWSAGDDKGAAAAFRRAAELRPAEPRAQANFAEASMRAGDLSAARTGFEALVRLGYERAAAHFNLGVIAERLGDRARARAEYQQAIVLDPKLDAARQALEAVR